MDHVSLNRLMRVVVCAAIMSGATIGIVKAQQPDDSPFASQDPPATTLGHDAGDDGGPSVKGIFIAYLITLGWAIVGSVSMGLGIIIALKIYVISHPHVDEWELIKNGNMAMAVVMASVIIALGIVVSRAIH